MTTLLFRRYGTVDSTNRIAMELARSGEPEGCVVLAQSQSAGRGRNGRAWWDEPGKAVLMSLVLRPGIGIDALSKLSLAVGVGAAAGIEAVCPGRIELKWPNDLMIGDRKVGGILIETDISQDPPIVVVGIGVNVIEGSLPTDISDKAACLQAHSNTALDVKAVAQAVADRVFSVCSELTSGHWDTILAKWRDRMWGIGKRVQIVSGGQTIAGVICGVATTGAIEIETADGSRAAIVSAETITVQEQNQES